MTWDLPIGSRERWADDYERGRPGWPAGVVEVAGLASSATVLDLGAGTGKLTGLLVSAFRTVVAVEPQEAMRRVLAARHPDAEALDGTADLIPLASGSVDAVFVAQAFHWFDTRPVLAEIGRVLGAGGAIVMMWNVPAGPWRPSIAAVERLLLPRAPREGDSGVDPLDLSRRHATAEYRSAFGDSPFGALREARLPNPQTLDRDGLVAYFASMSWIADLPDTDRLPLLGDVRSLLEANEYRRQWESHVYWTRLTMARGTSD